MSAVDENQSNYGMSSA